jgi:hypothetical protein
MLTVVLPEDLWEADIKTRDMVTGYSRNQKKKTFHRGDAEF